jgi:hypothetical protein
MTLSSLLTHDHGAERLLRGSGVRRDSSEREGERRSSRFSPMAPLVGGAVEMTTRRCLTEVTDGALMGR